MDQLTQLAIKYGTDKWSKKHHYTPIYYELFKDMRESVKKVLEIGVAEGASLFMWQDFFPNATIYGFDNDHGRVKLDSWIERQIFVFEGDQSSKQDLESLLEKTGNDLDLVIEDGSHKPEDQIFTCLTLMPLLNKKVVYVIEDVAEDTKKDVFTQIYNAGYDCEMLMVGKRYDDRLLIVRK